MTVKEIVKKWLEENEYDGLFDDCGECACVISDLMPCDSEVADCCAGWLIECPEDCGEHKYHITNIFVDKEKKINENKFG